MQFAAPQFERAVHARRQTPIVGDQDQRGADLPVQFQHQFVDLRGVVLIEVAGRLVTEHAGRSRHQGARHGGPLALAAAQFARLVAEAHAEPDPSEQFAGALARLADRRAADQQRHADVFERGEFRQQVMELVDEAERAVAQFSASAIGQPRHGLALDLDFTAGRLVEAAEDVQQGALAGARGADDRDRLVAAHVEADIVQHVGAQVAFFVDLGHADRAQDDVGVVG